MNKNEVIEMLALIRVAYPSSFRNMPEADIKAIVALWTRQFEEYDVNIVKCAIDSIISTDTSDFMPSIGKIKDMITKLTTDEEMTELEAWNIVKKAISRSGYYAQEEFDKLPAILQKLVGSPQTLFEWSQTDSEQVNTVVSSNFQRSYKARVKNEKELLALPTTARNMIESFKYLQLEKGD